MRWLIRLLDWLFAVPEIDVDDILEMTSITLDDFNKANQGGGDDS